MHKYILAVLFLVLNQFNFAQYPFQVSGRVIDVKTRESLPFVNIIINNSNHGGTTDIDGKFLLKSVVPVKSIRLTFVGYEPKVITITDKTRDILVQLVQKEIDLNEVEILPGINPAHRIIRNAIDNKDDNDPEKVKSFAYTAYDKTIFTLDNDTTFQGDFSALVDTSGQGDDRAAVRFEISADSVRNDSARIDSINRSVEKFIEKQYLFLMENVTKRKFMAPDRSYNKVIATKVSGFKDPIFVFLTTQIQSFSFYKPFISILMKNYINPIGAGGLSKYFFKIEDTAYMSTDTIFIISFRPKKGTNFDGMKGLISINSRGWAIQNVIAEPFPYEGGMRIRIHQLYELIGETQWFPVQLNTDIVFNNARAGKYKAVGRGRSYIRDIVLNPELVRREFNHLDTEVDKDATSRDEPFWNQYRVDSLSQKDERTYHILDSIGKAENFDKTAKTIQTLLTGRIPWGPIDLEINKFLGYNTYEGLIVGAGAHTNDHLSEWFKVGAYFQYSFAIVTPKYGFDASILVNRRRDFSINTTFFSDLTESGGVSYPGEKPSVLIGDFRQLLLKKLDRTKNFSFSLEFRGLKFFMFNLGLSANLKKSTTFDLTTFESNVKTPANEFRFTTFTTGFKWAPGEKFVQTTRNKISLGTKFPIIFAQFTAGIRDLLGGQFNYNRVDLKIIKTFNIKYIGKFSIQLQGGFIDEPIPACNLYYLPGTWREFSLYARNSFSAMRSNEFLSNKYASLFLYHDFGYLLFKGKKWFHPEFAVAQNIGFGWLDHPEYYQSIDFKPGEMNLGFYESGLLVNNLIDFKLYNIGLGAFYRWGPYSFDDAWDNVGVSLSVGFPF